MVSQEAINQHLTNIDQFYADQNFSALFQEARVLYEESDGTYPYFYGACFMNAWGTQQDFERAAHYLEQAAYQEDNYMYACYMAGLAYYRMGEYPQAIEWLAKAEEAGDNDAIVFLADSAAASALNLWDEIRNCINQSDFAQGVQIIKQYCAIAMDKYEKAANTAPETMNNMFWCGLGRVCILLYNLSTSGCLDLTDFQSNSLGAMASAGFQVMGAKWDHDAHYQVFKTGVSACNFMDEFGAHLVAEYFRAYLALLDSQRHNSAEAFYRARWHMKRIGELRRELPAHEADEVANVMQDMDSMYQKQNKKYGSMVISMMRSGKLPDISVSYYEGKAPAVESCQNFMNMYHQELSGAVNRPQTAQGKGNSLAGLLKNIFKF